MQRQTKDSFGFKWDRFPIQPGEARPALAKGQHRLQRNGWSLEEFESWVNGKRVLDAGCGMGWYTEFLSERNPDGEVIGVDIAPRAISKGLELGNGPLIVGDITALPFPDDSFDYIACEEVIHHTPDPVQTLSHLVEKLKPGGTFTMYIYKEKPLLREMADATIRETTTVMNIEDCLAFSRRMADLGQALYEVDDTIEVPEIPTLDIPGGEYTVHEFVYRFLLKCYFDWETEDADVSTAANFDWYHPEYAYRYTEDAVREMVADTGLKIEVFNELMSGYSVRATNPT